MRIATRVNAWLDLLANEDYSFGLDIELVAKLILLYSHLTTHQCLTISASTVSNVAHIMSYQWLS